MIYVPRAPTTSCLSGVSAAGAAGAAGEQLEQLEQLVYHGRSGGAGCATRAQLSLLAAATRWVFRLAALAAFLPPGRRWLAM